MKPIIEKLLKAWADAEKELRNELEKLGAMECKCGWDEEDYEPETTLFIHCGKWPELMNTCLNCGGVCDC